MRHAINKLRIILGIIGADRGKTQVKYKKRDKKTKG